MATINSSVAIVTQAMANGADDQNISPITLSVTTANVGGIGIVTVTWAENIGHFFEGQFRTHPAGNIDLNSADVVSPTTYYVYLWDNSGTTEAKVSTTNPALDGAISEYFVLAILRIKSVGGTATVYSARYIGSNGLYRAIHNLVENAEFSPPVWLQGSAITTSAGGKISIDAGYMRYIGNAPFAINALTEELLMLDDETTVAGLNDITTYANGDTITAGKYHKVLIGVKRDTSATITGRLIVVRQGKPSVEYASLSDAVQDAEGVAPASFGSNYRFDVLPLYYYAMLKGDYTDYEQADIRASGLGGSGGGGSGGGGGVTDHGALSGLGDDDHTQYLNTTRHDTTTRHSLGTVVPHDDHGALSGLADDDHTQYLKADGTRGLSGDWSVSKAITTSSTLKSVTYESTQATGTAPLTVASTTVVTNLNADKLDGNDATAFAVSAKGVTNGDSHDHAGGDGAQIDHGGLGGLADDDHTQYLLADGSRQLTGGWNMGNINVYAKTFNSSVLGDAPFTVASSTVVTGLNADQLDGQHASAFQAAGTYIKADGSQALTDNWNAGSKNITTTGTVSGNQLASTVSTGTAPLTVASTTVVTGLNADTVDGVEAAAFLKADGSVNLTGNLTVNSGVTIDGTDISAHVANTNAHHNAVTLATPVENVFSLTGQSMDLDNQTATYVFAGPSRDSSPAKPSFRALNQGDVPSAEGTMTLVGSYNDNVALGDYGVDHYFIGGPTTTFIITGFQGGYPGRTITVMNTEIAKNWTIAHNSVRSDSTNRIICPGTMSDTFLSTTGVCTFVYYGTIQKWVMTSMIT